MQDTLMGLTKMEYETIASCRTAIRRFLRHSEEAARSVGLTPQQHQLLLAVKGQPGREWACVGELADALQIRHHAAVGLVDRCESAGLVRRAPGLRDRRQVRVLLTPHGEEVLGQLVAVSRNELERLRDGMWPAFTNGAM
jgi:DNA-binding MarR family transcriptional regulator